MGKAVAYIALIVVCVGVGVLIGGIGVYFGRPHYDENLEVYRREASCFPVSHLRKDDSIEGIISLTQAKNKPLQINVNISGLPPKKLGFHVHTYGVLNANCSTAGQHFNPQNYTHGGPQDMIRHAGDLGNIDASYFPVSTIKITDSVATLFGQNSILGRSVVIHEKEDDLKDQNSAGPRLACCTIQLNNIEAPALVH